MLLSEATDCDQEEDEVAIARARTEEITVQVMLDDGFWHREADWETTACDLKIQRPIDRRPKKYEGRLCPDCWTQSELDRTQAVNLVTDEDFETGEFTRIEYGEDGRPKPPSLTSMTSRQQIKSARIDQRLTEIKNQRNKEKP